MRKLKTSLQKKLSRLKVRIYTTPHYDALRDYISQFIGAITNERSTISFFALVPPEDELPELKVRAEEEHLHVKEFIARLTSRRLSDTLRSATPARDRATGGSGESATTQKPLRGSISE